jgi:hypothetical protein
MPKPTRSALSKTKCPASTYSANPIQQTDPEKTECDRFDAGRRSHDL